MFFFFFLSVPDNILQILHTYYFFSIKICLVSFSIISNFLSAINYIHRGYLLKARSKNICTRIFYTQCVFCLFNLGLTPLFIVYSIIIQDVFKDDLLIQFCFYLVIAAITLPSIHILWYFVGNYTFNVFCLFFLFEI